jgi:hypothetical protein
MNPAPKPKRRNTRKRKPSKAETDYYDRVAELGCVICQMPAEVHHLLTGKGMGLKSSSQHVIPLCPDHHRTGGPGVAIHAGIETWEAKHGTELHFLQLVRDALNV